jgi:hypothetical protein
MAWRGRDPVLERIERGLNSRYRYLRTWLCLACFFVALPLAAQEEAEQAHRNRASASSR